MSEFDPARYHFDMEKDLLGRGSYGSVYKAQLKKSFFWSHPKTYPEFVAVKIIPENRSGYSDTELVLQDFVNFRHPNIVQYFKFLVKEEGIVSCHHIYMEYCDTDLSKVLKERKARKQPLSGGELVHVTRSLAKGVQHLHSQGLIHRDIKPSNILLNIDNLESELINIQLKLADFNISKLCDGSEGTLTISMGTTQYRAPEVLKTHKNRYAKYGLPADIFSLGAVIFEASTLQNLVDDEQNIPANVQKKLDTMSGHIKDFLHDCLQEDPGNRMIIEDVLGHPILSL